MEIKKDKIRDNDTAVIIPAYREYINLTSLIPAIEKVVPTAYIIVVDDSPKIESMKLEKWIKSKGSKKIIYISRKTKSGRGSAVFEGMGKALNYTDIKTIVEMDADLSHSPQEIIRLIKGLENADMVIGSRYLKDSQVRNWPLRRLILSRIINKMLNIWLGLDISDYTNGFRAYRRKTVEFLTKINLKERGFIALTEIAFRVKNKGFRIAEIPASFTDRKFGKSNADLTEHIASFMGVIRIKFNL